MATVDNTENHARIDAIDAMAEHLSKAIGIVGAVHAASMGDGPPGDNDIKDAVWAAYDELEALRDAFANLQALLRDAS